MNQIVLAGGTVVFRCATLVEPLGNIQWTHNGEIIENISSTELWLLNVSLRDAGEYICLVSSIHGPASATTSLQVQGLDSITNKQTIKKIYNLCSSLPHTEPPHFIVHPGNTIAPTQSNTTLNCSATGFPELTITWLKNGVTLVDEVSSRGLTINSSLHLSGLSHSDTANYSCRAVNFLASQQEVESTSGYLEVQCEFIHTHICVCIGYISVLLILEWKVFIMVHLY